jgi:hypothetical protein
VTSSLRIPTGSLPHPPAPCRRGGMGWGGRVFVAWIEQVAALKFVSRPRILIICCKSPNSDAWGGGGVFMVRIEEISGFKKVLRPGIVIPGPKTPHWDPGRIQGRTIPNWAGLRLRWGQDGVGSSFKVKRMIVVHSHPPSHVISNVNEWQMKACLLTDHPH